MSSHLFLFTSEMFYGLCTKQLSANCSIWKTSLIGKLYVVLRQYRTTKILISSFFSLILDQVIQQGGVGSGSWPLEY